MQVVKRVKVKAAKQVETLVEGMAAGVLDVVVGQVYDLLNFNTKQPKVLQVRHSPKVGFFVDDLSEVTIDSPQDLCVGCKSLLLVVLFPCAHAM